MFRVNLLIVLLITSFLTPAFAEVEALYNAQTGTLHIPNVKVSGDTSGTVYRVDMVNNGGWNFGLSSVINALSPTLEHIVISGGSQVSKNGTLQLKSMAISSDGAWTDVTSSAVWSKNSSVVGSVTNGQVITGFVSDDQQVSIRASYSVGSVSRSSTHIINVSANRISNLYLKMINADSSTLGVGPLYKQPNDGFLFHLGGITYEITSSQMQQATTYPAYVIALEKELASLRLSDTITVSLGDVFTYAHPLSFNPVSGTTIVLECNSQDMIRAAGFSNVLDDPTVTFISTF